TGLLRRTGPRAAADDGQPAAGVDPGRGVSRCPAVVFMPAIGHPFAYVAGKIVQAPCIGREAAHRGRAPVAVAIVAERVAPAAPGRGAVARAGEVAGAFGRAALPPRERRRRARPQRVFELRLTWQPVAAAGLL